MADKVVLSATKRDDKGKSTARRLRRAGIVPAVMYGHGEDPASLQVDEKELSTLLSRISASSTLIDLEIDGERPRQVLIREVQRHPWKRAILHLDFFQIKVDEAIRVAVPVRLTGDPVGVKVDGGILQQHRHEIEIECLPTEIPTAFELDVEELEIGDSLHVSDIDPGGVAIIDDAEAVVCTVVPPTVIQVEEEEEEEIEGEELEPEVIGREGEEPGEDEGEPEEAES